MIVLNEIEQRLATFLAKKRHENARNKGISNGRMGPQSDWETDLEGIAAEIAFCKAHNVYPDLQLEVLETADAFTLDMGAVDVKSTKYRNGMLLAVMGKTDSPPDSYALMIGEFPRYRFVGWARAGELLRDENIKNLGHGDGYALPQEKLRAAE